MVTNLLRHLAAPCLILVISVFSLDGPAGGWCGITLKHSDLRIYVHYLWVSCPK